ncbi:MAG: ribosome small subunit-dependent GTPase A [Bacillota bacterium]
MPFGQVVRFHGGFYFVMEQNTGVIRQCVRRGKLVKARICVGDLVVINEATPGRFVIEELLPRRTELVRPLVTNVEQALIVFAALEPEPNFQLLDTLIMISTIARIRPIICFNKIDLNPEINRLEEIKTYGLIGFHSVLTSAVTGEGVDELRAILTGYITVITGPSGVGKSSLLNAAEQGLRLKTGEINPKTRRGRHVTRLTELLPLRDGGFIVDTPGFTSIDIPEIPPAALGGYFPEIASRLGSCRFNNCLHLNEPDCTVQQAVKTGAIARFRYDSYCGLLNSITKQERTKRFD